MGHGRVTDALAFLARCAQPARLGAVLALGVVLAMPEAGSAWGQDAQPAPPPAGQPAPPASAPPSSGLFEAIGRWFDQGASNFRDHLRGAQGRVGEISTDAASASRSIGDSAATAGRTIGSTAVEVGRNAADVTREAVGTMVTLPNARVVQGRQVCPLAPNGAPDCQVAATALCKSRGFNSGRSLDFTSAQKCPARTWLAGREGDPSTCTTETFISRAMCQ